MLALNPLISPSNYLTRYLAEWQTSAILAATSRLPGPKRERRVSLSGVQASNTATPIKFHSVGRKKIGGTSQ